MSGENKVGLLGILIYIGFHLSFAICAYCLLLVLGLRGVAVDGGEADEGG